MGKFEDSSLVSPNTCRGAGNLMIMHGRQQNFSIGLFFIYMDGFTFKALIQKMKLKLLNPEYFQKLTVKSI